MLWILLRLNTGGQNKILIYFRNGEPGSGPYLELDLIRKQSLEYLLN